MYENILEKNKAIESKTYQKLFKSLEIKEFAVFTLESWRCLFLERKAVKNLESVLKSRDNTLLTKVCIIKAMIFPVSHVWMWELNHKEGWASKNWCFWIVKLKKTLECPLNSKKIKPINPKGNQYWIFIGRTDAEAEAPILWPSDVKSQLIGKDPDAGKDWGQKEKEAAGLTASLTQMTWIWINSGRQWRTGKPGMLQSIGSLRVRHNLAT